MKKWVMIVGGIIFFAAFVFMNRTGLERRNNAKLDQMGENAGVFRSFFSELESKTGCWVLITSGYRSTEKQRILHKKNPKNAPPGKSRHEWKKAMEYLEEGSTTSLFIHGVETKWSP